MINKSSLSVVIGLAAISVFKKNKSGNKNEEMVNFFAHKYGIKGSINKKSSLIIRNEQMLLNPFSYIEDESDVEFIEFEIPLSDGVPKWISKFQNLKELVLSETGIYELPIEVFELRNLEILDISRNPISSIPDQIKRLSKLKVLDISRTDIAILPYNMFRYMPNLYHFEALWTPLRELNSDILETSLSRLILDNNGKDIKLNFSSRDVTKSALNYNKSKDFIMTPEIVRYLLDILKSKETSELRRF